MLAAVSTLEEKHFSICINKRDLWEPFVSEWNRV